MNSLIVISSLGLGGAEFQAVEMANQLASRGIKIHLIILRGGNVAKLQLHPLIKVTESVISAKRCALLNKIEKIGAMMFVRAYLKQEQIDHVLAFLDEAISVCGAAVAASSRKVKFTICQVYIFGPDRFRLMYLPDMILKAAFAISDNVLSVSSLVQEALIDRARVSREKIFVINNGVNFSKINKLAELESSIFLPKSEYVLAVGRLDPIKRFDLLLHAFVRLKKEVPTISLLIVGEGPDRRRLEKIIARFDLSDSVLMPGACENPFPAMRRAKMLVVCSASEGFGTVVLEAIVCSTPVVSNLSVGAVVDIPEFHKYGVIEKNESAKSLYEAMRKCLEKFETTKVASLDPRFDEVAVSSLYYQSITASVLKCD